MKQPWSDEEVGHLVDLAPLTAAQAAKVLGRTRKSVLHKRAELRRGIERRYWWISDDDLDFVAAYPEFTAAQIGRHLGRTPQSISAMRQKLRDMGAAGVSLTTSKSPNSVAGRTLVAKTCARCGLLLDASWFTSRGTKRVGHYAPHCRKCMVSKRTKAASSRYAKRFSDRLQAVTLETATNRRKEWTNSEMEVLSDLTKTNFEKALALGRTYYAVNDAMSSLGLRSRKEPVPDPANAQWFISLRPEMAALFTREDVAA